MQIHNVDQIQRPTPEPLPLVTLADGDYLAAPWPAAVIVGDETRVAVAAGAYQYGEVRLYIRLKNASAVYRLAEDRAELIEGTAPLELPAAAAASDDGLLGYKRGHRVRWDAGTEAWMLADGSGEPYVDGERTCPSCDKAAEPGGPDPCLGMIPAAIGACCGHGIHPGYLQFPGQPGPPNYTHGVYTGEATA